MAEAIVKTSSELHIEASEAARALNTAILDDSFSEISAKQEELKRIIGNHNKAAMNEDFAILRSREKPMLEAIEKLVVNTIAVSENVNTETKITTYDLKPATAYIDLLAFEKFCEGKTIAANTGWKYMIEKLNYLCALRVAKEIGDDVRTVEKRYHISPEAFKIDMGKTPTSNTQLLKQLQTIVDAVIFKDAGDGKNAYKATSHDVAWLVNTLTKAGKTAHGLTYANASTTRGLVTRILNRIVTDSNYKLEYKTKKEAEAEEAAKTEGENKE